MNINGSENYDLVILGGGTGSTIAAWTFASQGQRVAVIERKYIGGSCPNIACLPSKNILHSARVASYFRRGQEFGMFAGGLRVDMAAVRGRKRAMVSGLNEMYLDNYKQTGAEFIFGPGRFVGPKTLEVILAGGTTRRLRGANVIVSTGTRAALEPVPGLADAQPLTHVEALELDQVPGHLVVIGGGYVGLELSQAMRRFGSKVTVIDQNDRLLSREDNDVTKAIGDLFRDEGIDTVLNARAIRISGRSGDSGARNNLPVEVAGNRILGFTAFAVDAGEIMASVQTAMMAGLPYTALRDAIWAHPTLVEGLAPLFSSAPSLSADADTQAISPAMAHGRG